MSKTVAIASTYLDSFVLAKDFSLRAEGLELSPKQWELVSLIDGRRSAVDIARQLDIPGDVAWGFLCKLERMALVLNHRIQCPWPREIAAVPVQPAEPVLVAPAVAAVEVRQEEKATVVSPAQDAPAAPVKSEPASRPKAGVRLSFKQSSSEAKPATVKVALKATVKLKSPEPVAVETPAKKEASVVEVDKAASPAVPAPALAPLGACDASDKGPWPIKAVFEALKAKSAGDALVSQVLAYRVLLRVPAELVEAAGIQSVFLLDSDFMIRDLRFKQALETALREVAGVEWPAESLLAA